MQHEAGIGDADPSMIAIRTGRESPLEVGTHLAEATDDVVKFLDLARYFALGDVGACTASTTAAFRTVGV